MSLLAGLERAARGSQAARLAEEIGPEAWLRETLAKLERAERSMWLLVLPPYFAVAISRAATIVRGLVQQWDLISKERMP